ncbi:MAG: lamin tail domain-containing protein, partial [Bacteroidia bacterium]
MRKTLLFLLLLTVKLTFGQFRDNFSDGNFASDPTWVGQTSAFSVNAAKQLKTSLSAVAQTISLSTRSDLALNVSWEFSIQMNFDPSTSNLARIYLVADQSDLSGSLNGYFVQIGESGGADSYDLYRQTGNSVSRIIDCQPKNRANINFLSTKLRVTRTELGKWELHSSSNGGESYMMEGSVTDKTFTSTTSFGVYCKYTASRSDGFMFDDFVVEELIADRTPPQLIAVKVLEGSKVEATFSEAISLSSALVLENYKLKGTDEFPISVSATSFPHVFLLSFSGSFLSAPYTLVASGMYDLKGNVAFVSEATTFYVRPYVAIKGDLVINEIFADPSPAVGLPAVEFVELWNTTNNYLLLRDWKFKDLTATHSFLSDTIRPNEYVVLCPIADRDLFIGYGKTIGLTTWPTLNNDGDRLTLLSGDNVIIDEVSYLQTWYKDPLKDGGGYSLELIDPANRCGGIQNWQASLHPNGGSPGIQNSVYQFQLNSGPLLL